MTVEEILERLKGLRDSWYKYSSCSSDFDYAMGLENGHEQAADDLDDFISKIEAK